MCQDQVKSCSGKKETKYPLIFTFNVKINFKSF
jgi:hypothetical protein